MLQVGVSRHAPGASPDLSHVRLEHPFTLRRSSNFVPQHFGTFRSAFARLDRDCSTLAPTCSISHATIENVWTSHLPAVAGSCHGPKLHERAASTGTTEWRIPLQCQHHGRGVAMLRFLLRLRPGQRIAEGAVFLTFIISNEDAINKEMAPQTRTFAEQTKARGKLHSLTHTRGQGSSLDCRNAQKRWQKQ